MGLFGKTITDEEWLHQVLPLYKAALPFIKPLNEAVANDLIDEEIKAVIDASHKIPIIAEEIKHLPSPSSSEARSAKKNLQNAMKCYVDGIKQGFIFFKDLSGGPGERLRVGGVSRRAAAGRLAFQKSFFEGIIRSAGESMERATTYLSKK